MRGLVLRWLRERSSSLRGLVVRRITRAAAEFSGEVPRRTEDGYGRRVPPVLLNLDDLEHVKGILAGVSRSGEPVIKAGWAPQFSDVEELRRVGDNDLDDLSISIAEPEISVSFAKNECIWHVGNDEAAIEAVDRIYYLLRQRDFSIKRRMKRPYLTWLVVFGILYTALFLSTVAAEPAAAGSALLFLMFLTPVAVLLTPWVHSRSIGVAIVPVRYEEKRTADVTAKRDRRQHRRELVILVVGIVLGAMTNSLQEVGTDLLKRLLQDG